MNDDAGTSTARGDEPRKELGRRIRRGTIAVGAAQIASQVVSIATLAFLFRRLGPEPFGLIGMATPALLLARMLAGFGLQESVVQAEGMDDEARDRVFRMNQLAGLAGMVLMLAAAPVLAWLFQSPSLLNVTAALAPTLPLMTLSSVHQGWWQRHLALAALMKVRLTAQTCAAVAACFLAWRGAGVWSLVGQQWLELALLAALIWWASDWRPRWRGSWWDASQFRFGGWYTGAAFCFYWAQNIDKWLLAGLLGGTPAGRAALGMYHQAFNLTLKPVHLVVSPASSVVLPALARLKRDRAALASLGRQVWWLLAAILAPAAVGLALVAEDVFWVLGGARWASAATLLVALSPLVLAQGLINISGSFFAAVGKTRSLFRGALAQAIALSAAAGAAVVWAQKNDPTPVESAQWMARAIGVTASAGVALPYLFYCARVASIDFRAFLVGLRPIVLSVLLMGLAVHAARSLTRPTLAPSLRLVVMVVLGATVYGWLLRGWWADVRSWWREWESCGSASRAEI